METVVPGLVNSAVAECSNYVDRNSHHCNVLLVIMMTARGEGCSGACAATDAGNVLQRYTIIKITPLQIYPVHDTPLV